MIIVLLTNCSRITVDLSAYHLSLSVWGAFVVFVVLTELWGCVLHNVWENNLDSVLSAGAFDRRWNGNKTHFGLDIKYLYNLYRAEWDTVSP